MLSCNDFSKYNRTKLFKIGQDPRFKYAIIKELLRRLGEIPSDLFGEELTRSRYLVENISNIRALLDNDLELEIDGVVNKVTRDGAYGLLMGLIETDKMKDHIIKLKDIVITPLIAKILFYNTVNFGLENYRYSATIEQPHRIGNRTWRYATHAFNSLDFLSNLALSGIKISRVFDRKTRKFIQAVYSK